LAAVRCGLGDRAQSVFGEPQQRAVTITTVTTITEWRPA